MCRTKMYKRLLKFYLFRKVVLNVSRTFRSDFIQIPVFRLYFSTPGSGNIAFTESLGE